MFFSLFAVFLPSWVAQCISGGVLAGREVLSSRKGVRCVYTSTGTTTAITHLFTGHDWDSAAQMYYAPYRYYIPGSARWLTRDPLGMIDGPNVYGYVKGGPTRLNDRSGMFAGEGLVLGCILGAITGLALDYGGSGTWDSCQSPCQAVMGCLVGMAAGAIYELATNPVLGGAAILINKIVGLIGAAGVTGGSGYAAGRLCGGICCGWPDGPPI